MKIEVTLDPACQEVTLLVQAPAMTEEVRQLLDALSPQAQPPLIGRQGQTLEVLEEEEILRLYAQEGKVFAVTPAGNTPCGCGCMRQRPGSPLSGLPESPTRRSST